MGDNGNSQKLEDEQAAQEKVADEQAPMLPATPPATNKLYKKRWLMLLIFCMCSFGNSFQWAQLNIIGNVVIKFYNESGPEDPSTKQLAIDWLSIIYMVTYIPLVFPAMYILNAKGLHICSIAGSMLTAIGAWIKAGAISPDSFGRLFCGQTVVAIAQIFILGLPAHLAAIWFGEKEVATATSIGVFANQAGIVAGFLVPPLIVPDSEDPNVIRTHLRYLLLGTAVFCTLVYFIILLFFRAKPPLPPSVSAQAKARPSESNASPLAFLHSLARLFTNWGYVLLMITYGINTGSLYVISSFLNLTISNYFPGDSEHVGNIRLTFFLAGLLGLLLAGVWLDQTKTFKLTTIGLYAFSLIAMVAFTLFMHFVSIIWIIYVVVGLLGFFMTGYLSVGIEFGAEITYPEPEGTSSSLLNASAQVFRILLTMAMFKMLVVTSCLVVNVVLIAILLVGTGVTFIFIRSDLRRQNANKQSTVTGAILRVQSDQEATRNAMANFADGITTEIGSYPRQIIMDTKL